MPLPRKPREIPTLFEQGAHVSEFVLFKLPWIFLLFGLVLGMLATGGCKDLAYFVRNW